MITKNHFILFILLSIFSTFSCKDYPCKGCTSFAKNPENLIIDWANFKPGTFFVYSLKDSLLEFDTLSVSNSSYLFYDDICGMGCGEIHKLRLRHSNSKYFPRWNDSSSVSELEIEAYFGEYIQMYGEYRANRFLNPNSAKGTSSGTYEVIDFYESFELYGKNYSEVYHLKRQFHQSQSSNVTEMLWSNKFGIITISLESGLTWELIDYNIIL